MRPNDTLKELRPLIQKENGEANDLERFQNEVLRPIFKLQHEIFQMEWFQSGHFKHIQSLENHILKRSALSSFLSKNIRIFYRYVGIICGLFTDAEYQFYLGHQTLIDKRIKELLITRLLSYEA